MRRAAGHAVDATSVGIVGRIVEDGLGWIFTRSEAREYGIDGYAEVVTGGIVTGRLLALQIKGGPYQFRRAERDGSGWQFWASNDHLHYWLGYALPVLVILVRPDDGAAFWQVIRPETVRENPKGFTMTVPAAQRLDASAAGPLTAIATADRGLMESFPEHCAVLPPAAARILSRAWDTDALPAARLAGKLAAGRRSPALTTGALCAARPAWLAATAAAQDLWLAAAAYTYEHGCPAPAGEAFALAAGAPGPRSARAHAVAGLTFLSWDRARARSHLEQARAGGQVLLADVGLAELDVPEGDRRPPQVPASVQAAVPAQLAAEPAVLGFLAGRELRLGNFLSSLRYRERQYAAAGETDTVTRLALADVIRRQALTDPDSSARELQRALGHATAAMHERRRWDGPSDQALAAALDILIVTSDWAAMLTASLPARQGGTALPHEAASPAVARRAVVAAAALGNDEATEFFYQALPDPDYRRRLHEQVASLDSGAPAGPQAQAWLQLLDNSRDDEAAVLCIAALARLGVWPARADELLDRSVLPPDAAAILRAIYLARSGRQQDGIARLRGLAGRTVLAATELVDLITQDIGTSAAIAECARQRERWPHPGLSQRHASLLDRAGRHDEAAGLIETLITGQTVPPADRMRLADWLARRRAAAGDFAGAERAARAGLAIGADPQLAWTLIRVLLGTGRVTAAREALGRHQPDPQIGEEIRLWYELHLAVPLTAGDARTLAGLAAGHPDVLPPAAVLPVLHREAALAVQAGEPYPPDVLAAMAALAAQPPPAPLQRAAAGSEDVEAVIARVQTGLAAQADIAAAAGLSYGAVLLHRHAGVLPASDVSPAMRTAGEAAAAAALDQGACVADLSAVHTLQLLPGQARAAIGEHLPGLSVSRDAVRDAARTRAHVRDLAAAAIPAARPGPAQPAIDPAELALLTSRALYLETTSSAAARPVPAARNAPAADAGLAAAAELGLPLWCDDNVLRQRARGRSIPSFSVLDLTTVLRRRGAGIEPEDELARRLAGHGVADLPLTAADLISLAAGNDWEPGPAHAALARPGWWSIHDGDWGPLWHQIAAAARTCSPEALTVITRAALTGALEHVRPALQLQRYQQLVAISVAACHTVGQPVPDGFLASLADGAPERLVPKPEHILTSVITELSGRGVPDPAATAIALLPGAGLT